MFSQPYLHSAKLCEARASELGESCVLIQSYTIELSTTLNVAPKAVTEASAFRGSADCHDEAPSHSQRLHVAVW